MQSEHTQGVNPPTYQELYALAYIPNQWKCPRCGYVLTKSSIHAGTGEMGTTEEDRQSEPCPNDGVWMVPVTYKEDAYALAVQIRELLQRTEWVANNGYEFHGKRFDTFKTLDGMRWGYGYGVVLHGELLIENLVTGFACEDSALEHAIDYALDVARESSCDQVGE